MKEHFFLLETDSEFDEASKNLLLEIKNFLHIENVDEVKIFNLYYVHPLNDAQKNIVADFFTRNGVDVYQDFSPLKKFDRYFRVRLHDGQYNQRQDMLEHAFNTQLTIDCRVRHSQIIALSGITDTDFTRIRNFHINPVELKEVSLDEPYMPLADSALDDLQPVSGFMDLSNDGLEKMLPLFSMDIDDLRLCRDYFKSEMRDPTMSELKMIDTYWSDHCRHTTFLTALDSITAAPGPYAPLFNRILSDYRSDKKQVSPDKPECLMDLATINMKKMRRSGDLDDVEISDEVNAAALFIDVEVHKKKEPWVLYFKNETHNHPTEIEPYGGASTCIGGGIRDPLSGRSIVYQTMRVSGAKDPHTPFENTRPNKLAQRKICKTALQGNSDYGNQIGTAGGYVREVYHDGFEAKRLELGALVAAAPRAHVVRATPSTSDVVVLLGGKTGRDGLGAAVGSSKIQTDKSLEQAGAEVQKGNPLIQRKIMRLFRNGAAARLIKKCNDFGAGGVAVAVGELADGLSIDLDAVPLKYSGMHGGEIALSESQERMAVVIGEKDLPEFLAYAKQEDVAAAVIARVEDHNRIMMKWHGKTVIDVRRDFLNSNGAKKHAAVVIEQQSLGDYFNPCCPDGTVKEAVAARLRDVRFCSQKQAAEQFDSTIGRGTLLMPLGGGQQITPQAGMAAKIPVPQGNTTTCSFFACGYDADLASLSPFHGGYYAVIDSIMRIAAMGGDYKKIRLSFQEYFERLVSATAWGKPTAALLGAYHAMSGLDRASIGGKDSMSGSFEDISVPPSLMSFAVATGSVDTVISRELKSSQSVVVLVTAKPDSNGILDLKKLGHTLEGIYSLAEAKKIRAASTLTPAGLVHNLVEMGFGNRIGVDFCVDENELFAFSYGSLLLECAAESDIAEVFNADEYTVIAHTNDDMSVRVGDNVYLLLDFEAAYTEGLAAVYPLRKSVAADVDGLLLQAKAENVLPPLSVKKHPCVLIPIVPGVHSEYDTADAFRLQGATVRHVIFKDGTHAEWEASIEEFISVLKNTDILVLANGAVMGDAPDAQGKLYHLLLTHAKTAQAVAEHLEKDRFIIGIGAGFAGLVQSGLIEFGAVKRNTSVSVQMNAGGTYRCGIRTVAAVQTDSPWLAQADCGTEFSTVFSTQFGRLAFKNGIEDFLRKGQVCSIFADSSSEDEVAVEALCSPCKKVFGCISLPDRMAEGLYKNVPLKTAVPYIKNICGV